MDERTGSKTTIIIIKTNKNLNHLINYKYSFDIK